jgi:hypothetical protein
VILALALAFDVALPSKEDAAAWNDWAAERIQILLLSDLMALGWVIRKRRNGENTPLQGGLQ